MDAEPLGAEVFLTRRRDGDAVCCERWPAEIGFGDDRWQCRLQWPGSACRILRIGRCRFRSHAMTGWHNGEMNVLRLILARIAEDERGELSSMRRGATPSRGLREAAFKRRLVDDAPRSVEWNFARGEDNDLHVKQPILGQLAMVYADHPDFDARWTR
jgi:hypothetical protein